MTTFQVRFSLVSILDWLINYFYWALKPDMPTPLVCTVATTVHFCMACVRWRVRHTSRIGMPRNGYNCKSSRLQSVWESSVAEYNHMPVWKNNKEPNRKIENSCIGDNRIGYGITGLREKDRWAHSALQALIWYRYFVGLSSTFCSS